MGTQVRRRLLRPINKEAHPSLSPSAALSGEKKLAGAESWLSKRPIVSNEIAMADRQFLGRRAGARSKQLQARNYDHVSAGAQDRAQRPCVSMGFCQGRPNPDLLAPR